MIIPNVRATFGRAETDVLVRRLARHTGHSVSRWEGKLREEGLDALLDDRRALPALMEGGGVSAMSASLVFYVMVRHALLESGLDDPEIADYVAALLVEFGQHGRAFRIARSDDKTYRYLVDLVADIEDERSEQRQFLLRAHLGNYSLWLAGLFPDYVVARVHRRGAPGLHYYEGMGATGYRMASECGLAGHYELRRVYQDVAQRFSSVRRALNTLSDRFFLPVSTTPVDRLLRQVADGFEPN